MHGAVLYTVKTVAVHNFAGKAFHNIPMSCNPISLGIFGADLAKGLVYQHPRPS